MESTLFDNARVGATPQDALGFLVNLLQSATNFALICEGLDGTILLWNEGARRVYGYAVEEVLGLATTDILHPPRMSTPAGRTRCARRRSRPANGRAYYHKSASPASGAWPAS